MSVACQFCGYDLTGLAETGDCPECGRPYDLSSPYRAVYKPEHPAARWWKVVLLAVLAVSVLVCGGLLSILADNPIGLIVTTLIVASLPGFGAFVYWWAERPGHNHRD